MNSEVNLSDIQAILDFFSKTICLKAKDCEKGSQGHDAMQKCIELMKLDYNILEISNQTGELSTHYPSQIIIPEYETQNGISAASSGSQQQRQQTIYENTYDTNKLRDLINKARFARCRARFPLPVILYRGKYICRSATLSGGPEIYGRSGLNYLFFGDDSTAKPNLDDEAYEAQESSMPPDVSEVFSKDPTEKNSEWQLFDRVRSQDIKLLKTLNVGTIVDLMVEKKKVKFGLNVTSSEKVDKENRYAEFTICSLPYPGCEFFREYRDNNYSGIDLVFDWSQAHVDAQVFVPPDATSAQLNIDWDGYKNWDLVKITQNYMKLLLKYVQDNSSGLLVHCISGWDRTPLFVSLLRLSLWADGVIHQSLNATQILYFTIAYDWMLFGHNLPDRLSKGEEIFFFCFYALKYIMEDEYSVLSQRYKSKNSSGSSSIGVLRTDSECMLDGILFDGESRGSSVSLNSTCSCVSSTHGAAQEVAINPVAAATNNHQPTFHLYADDNNANGNPSWLCGHNQDSNGSIGCLSNDSSSNLSINVSAWSPQPKRTSPVSVPSMLRQRQESSSSISVGSWQMISGTGSLRTAECVVQPPNDASNSIINIGGSQNQVHHHNHHNSVHQQQQQQQQQQHQQQQQQQTNQCNNFYNNFNNAVNLTNIANQTKDSGLLEDDCFSSIYNNDTTLQRQERLNSVRTLFYNCYLSTIAFKLKNGQDSALGSLLGNFAEKVGLAQRTPV